MTQTETLNFSQLKNLKEKSNFFAIDPVVFAPGTQTDLKE
jgi:hypothetical protein